MNLRQSSSKEGLFVTDTEDSPLGNLREELDASEAANQETETIADSSSGPDSQSSESEPEDESSGPAFPYSQATQESVYPRASTWEQMDDLDLDVRLLLRDPGIRNLPKRELHDAVFRFAADNPEAIARLILQERGIEPEQDEI